MASTRNPDPRARVGAQEAQHNAQSSVAHEADDAEEARPGRCACCAHPLTAQKSLARGLGPVCAARRR